VATASAYKFAESVASAIGLPKEVDGFAAIKALNKATGIRIPKGLQNLEQKEIKHQTVLEKDQMMSAVRDAL
jgi:threonine synthase